MKNLADHLELDESGSVVMRSVLGRIADHQAQAML